MLKLSNRMQCAFRFVDKENNNEETLEWCVGTIATLSASKSSYQGVKPHQKKTAVEVKWDSNAHEDSSTSAVEVKKSMFNMHVKHS